MKTPLTKVKLQIRLEEGQSLHRLLLWDGGDWSLLAERTCSNLPRLREISADMGRTIRSWNHHGSIDPSQGNLETLGKELFRQAFPQAIIEALARAKAQFLILDLAPPLLGIPWELSHDGHDFLSFRYCTGRIVSDWTSEVSNRGHPDRFGRSVCILSNPTGDLPVCTHEGDYLSSALTEGHHSQVTWLNNTTNRNTLEPWLANCDVFHYCGHFVPASNGNHPSGWQLADGLYSSNEVDDLAKKSDKFPLLVFNNACQSDDSRSLEEGDTQSPFIQSFLANGCLHYIATHSKVLDQPSFELAKSFYSQVLPGTAVGTALQSAQRLVRSTMGSSHLTWSQYVLYGDPSTGLLGSTASVSEVKAIVSCQYREGTSAATSTPSRLLEAYPGLLQFQSREDLVQYLFDLPSQAVRFALHLINLSRDSSAEERDLPRISITAGEVQLERSDATGTIVSLEGLPVVVGEYVLDLSVPGQILTTRSVLDDARSVLGRVALSELHQVFFLDHGTYVFSQLEDSITVCEVGEEGGAPLAPPNDTAHAFRSVAPDQEPVLGWRPAIDQEIKTAPQWVLLEKLGEGGFGEVWKARNKESGEIRVFKFCFRADRARSLKRELTLFRLLRSQLGNHPQIVQVHDIYFDTPPYHLSMEYVDGLNLSEWLTKYGHDERLTESNRLELVAKIADAVRAAHNCGVIHRDIKPTNILVQGTPASTEFLNIKLTDFGIGRINSLPLLNDITAIGFSDTFSRTEMTTGTGSRLYMAPELLMGKESTCEADIYSLGIVLYQVLMGDCSEPLTTDWEAKISDSLLIDDLRNCLAGTPSQRFPNAGDLTVRLRSLEERRKASRLEEMRRSKEQRRKALFIGSLVLTGLAIVLSLALGTGMNRAWRAESESRHNLYYAQIDNIRTTLHENPTRARNLLYSFPQELRGWEWGHLVLRTNIDRVGFGYDTKDIRILDLTPDGQVLVTGHESRAVKCWDTTNGDRLWQIDSLPEVPIALATNQQSSLLAILTKRAIHLWSIRDRAPMAFVSSSAGFENVIHFHPSSDTLAALQSDGTFLLYEVPRNSTREIDCLRSSKVVDFDFLPENRGIITAGGNALSHTIDFYSGKIMNTVQTDTEPLELVFVDPTRNMAYFLSGIDLLFLDLDNMTFTDRSYQALLSKSRVGADLAHNGEVFATATSNSVLDFFMLETLNNYREWGCLGGRHSIRIGPEGRFVYTVDDDGVVRKRLMQDTYGGDVTIQGYNGWSHDFLFGPDGRTLILSEGSGIVSIWDILSGQKIIEHRLSDTSIPAIALSKVGGHFAFGNSDGQVMITDVSLGPLQGWWKAHDGAIHQIAFCLDDTTLLTTGSDSTLKSWSAQSGDHYHSFASVNPSAIVPLSIGKSVITQTTDHRIVELDISSFEEVQTYESSATLVQDLCGYANGKFFVGYFEGNQIFKWSRGQPKPLATNQTNFTVPHFLAISPQEDRLFLSSEIWDLDTLSPLCRLGSGKKAVSQDGRYVAIEQRAGEIYIKGSFPWRDDEYQSWDGAILEERIGAYKADYWQARDRFLPKRSSSDFKPSKDLPVAYDSIDFNGKEASIHSGSGMSISQYTVNSQSRVLTHGYAKEFGIPDIGNRLTGVIRYHGEDVIGGLRINLKGLRRLKLSGKTYSFLCDIYFPKESDGKCRALLNTSLDSPSPCELVVSSTGGLGGEKVYHGQVPTEKWLRLGCVVDVGELGQVSTYIDGAKVGIQEIPENKRQRWQLQSIDNVHQLALFVGTDTDPTPCYVSAVMLTDKPLTDEDFARLGGPDADGFVERHPAASE
jgi:serine/threonine protein kinase